MPIAPSMTRIRSRVERAEEREPSRPAERGGGRLGERGAGEGRRRSSLGHLRRPAAERRAGGSTPVNARTHAECTRPLRTGAFRSDQRRGVPDLRGVTPYGARRGPWLRHPTPPRNPMLVDLTGFAGDCLISGRLELRAERVTDQLNAEATIQLVDVVLEGLTDGRQVSSPDVHHQPSGPVRRQGRTAARLRRPSGRRPSPIACRPRSGRTPSSVGCTLHPAARPCPRSPSAT